MGRCSGREVGRGSGREVGGGVVEGRWAGG